MDQFRIGTGVRIRSFWQRSNSVPARLFPLKLKAPPAEGRGDDRDDDADSDHDRDRDDGAGWKCLQHHARLDALAGADLEAPGRFWRIAGAFLSRRSSARHISPKAFRLLELLLEERPRALSKERLQEKLWPRTFVSEANLATLAAEARRAIGDSARGSKMLRTVYGFGYAFSGETREQATSAGPAPGSRFFLRRDEDFL